MQFCGSILIGFPLGVFVCLIKFRGGVLYVLTGLENLIVLKLNMVSNRYGLFD